MNKLMNNGGIFQACVWSLPSSTSVAKTTTLANNRILTFKRLQLVKKFLRDAKLFESYKRTIDDYITKGYAQRVHKEELDADGKPLWHLQHHAFFDPNKSGKLRVVFDCAARHKGTSLKDQLLGGPDLSNS